MTAIAFWLKIEPFKKKMTILSSDFIHSNRTGFVFFNFLSVHPKKFKCSSQRCQPRTIDGIGAALSLTLLLSCSVFLSLTAVSCLFIMSIEFHLLYTLLCKLLQTFLIHSRFFIFPLKLPNKNIFNTTFLFVTNEIWFSFLSSTVAQSNSSGCRICSR